MDLPPIDNAPKWVPIKKREKEALPKSDADLKANEQVKKLQMREDKAAKPMPKTDLEVPAEETVRKADKAADQILERPSRFRRGLSYIGSFMRGLVAQAPQVEVEKEIPNKQPILGPWSSTQTLSGRDSIIALAPRKPAPMPITIMGQKIPADKAHTHLKGIMDAGLASDVGKIATFSAGLALLMPVQEQLTMQHPDWTVETDFANATIDWQVSKALDPGGEGPVFIQGTITCPIHSIKLKDETVENPGTMQLTVVIDTSEWKAEIEQFYTLDQSRLDTSKSILDRHTSVSSEQRSLGASTLQRTIEGEQNIVGLSTRDVREFEKDTYNQKLEGELSRLGEGAEIRFQNVPLSISRALPVEERVQKGLKDTFAQLHSMTDDPKLRFQITQMINQEFTTNFTGALQARLNKRYGLDVSLDPNGTSVVWDVSKERDGRIILTGTVHSALNFAFKGDEFFQNPGSIETQIRVDTSTWKATSTEKYQLDPTVVPLTEPDLDASFDFSTLPLEKPQQFEPAYPPTPTVQTVLSGTYENKNVVYHHVAYQGEEVFHLEASSAVRKTLEIDGEIVPYDQQQDKDARRWTAHLPEDLPNSPPRNVVNISGKTIDFAPLDSEGKVKAMVGAIWEAANHDPELTYQITRLLTQGPLNHMLNNANANLYSEFEPHEPVSALDGSRRIVWTLERDDRQHLILSVTNTFDAVRPSNQEEKTGTYRATAVFDCTDWTADMKAQLVVDEWEE